MDFRIRVSDVSDIPQIDALFAKSYGKLLRADYAPSVFVTAVPLISKAQPKLVTSGTFYVAETNVGDLIGAGGWTLVSPFGEREVETAHIRHFGTDPDVVRCGVGRGILEVCLKDAKRAGATRVRCFSTLTAVPFYRSAGFVEIAPMNIELSRGIRFPAVSMELTLQ